MRIYVLFLALPACLDAGEPAAWPIESAELAFLLWVENDAVTRVGSAFRLEDGAPVNLGAAPLRRRPSETVLLLHVPPGTLRSTSPLIDLGRLMESKLLPETDPVCALRYREGRRAMTTGLPAGARLIAVAPHGATSNFEGLRSSLRFELPLAESPCTPPVEVRGFARGAEAIEDGAVFSDAARFRGTVEGDPYFELYDAHYLTPDEAIVVTPRGFFVLPRGARIESEAHPSYVPSSEPWLPWPPFTMPFGLMVLPEQSTPQTQRFLLLGDEFISEDVTNTWVVTLEREGATFRVRSSTVAPGDPVRAVMDHAGRALIASRRDGLRDTVLLWTSDGLSFERAVLPYRLNALSATGDAGRPHLLARSGFGRLAIGDLTERSESALVQLDLDGEFTESVRSVAAIHEGDGLRIGVGGEARGLRTTLLGAVSTSPPSWRVISPIIGPSTERASCSGLPDACGEVELNSELDQLTYHRRSSGPTWLFLLPTVCPHLIAVREDACTTHVPLEPVISIRTERSMHSIRPSPDGTRALVAGRGGRLFELVFEP